MENTNEYFDAWMKSQTQAFATLREQTERMMSFCQGAPASMQNPFDAWRDAALKAFSAAGNSNALQDTLSKTLGSTEAMQKSTRKSTGRRTVWLRPLRKSLAVGIETPPQSDIYHDRSHGNHDQG